MPVVEGPVLEIGKRVVPGDGVHAGGVAVAGVAGGHVGEDPCSHHHHARHNQKEAVEHEEQPPHRFTSSSRSITTAPADRPSVSARSSSARFRFAGTFTDTTSINA